MISWKKYRRNIPNYISFNKSKYELLYTDDFKDGKTLGETRWDPKQIVLMNGRPDKETVHTVFHECIHAISYEYGVNMTETQVLAFEKALPDLIRLFQTVEGKK